MAEYDNYISVIDLSYNSDPDISQQAAELRKNFVDLERVIMTSLPPSRRRSEAITCLETSCLFAIKALVHG